MESSARNLNTIKVQGSEYPFPDGGFYLSGYCSNGKFDSFVNQEDAPYQVPAGKKLVIDFLNSDNSAVAGSFSNQIIGYADTNVNNSAVAPTTPIPIHKFMFGTTKSFDDSWQTIVNKSVPASKYPYFINQTAGDLSYTAVCHLEDA